MTTAPGSARRGLRRRPAFASRRCTGATGRTAQLAAGMRRPAIAGWSIPLAVPAGRFYLAFGRRTPRRKVREAGAGEVPGQEVQQDPDPKDLDAPEAEEGVAGRAARAERVAGVNGG